MTESEEMQSYQGFAGFTPVLPLKIEFPATIENAEVAGILQYGPVLSSAKAVPDDQVQSVQGCFFKL